MLAHLGYSGLSLLIAALIALPVGVLIGHTGRPGRGRGGQRRQRLALHPHPRAALILLAVFLGFSALTWLVPLVVLAIPPILVNACEGVAGVDPGVRDAARGVGMTTWQQIIQVEVPIALPLILVGLRTSAIFVVATATIAAYIGLGGLGRFIIDGLASNEYGPVAGGRCSSSSSRSPCWCCSPACPRLVVPAGLRKQQGNARVPEYRRTLIRKRKRKHAPKDTICLRTAATAGLAAGAVAASPR